MLTEKSRASGAGSLAYAARAAGDVCDGRGGLLVIQRVAAEGCGSKRARQVNSKAIAFYRISKGSICHYTFLLC